MPKDVRNSVVNETGTQYERLSQPCRAIATSRRQKAAMRQQAKKRNCPTPQRTARTGVGSPPSFASSRGSRCRQGASRFRAGCPVIPNPKTHHFRRVPDFGNPAGKRLAAAHRRITHQFGQFGAFRKRLKNDKTRAKSGRFVDCRGRIRTIRARSLGWRGQPVRATAGRKCRWKRRSGVLTRSGW
jgi:hypothetical protein